jgi:N-formylglutamate deformylase
VPVNPLSQVAVVHPQAEPIALVCDSPHSGTIYPTDFRHAVALSDLRKCEDTHVEALWADAPAVGATLIHARFPRSYIDVNRACNDIDVAMLSGPWPGEARPSQPCIRLGNGLVFSKTTTFTDIYDRRLEAEELQRRIDSCWLPYRTALSEALHGALARFGKVWHLNLHSMPSNAYERLGRVSSVPLADIVLGDLGGTSCSPRFTHCVAEAFRTLGYSVAVNDPYAGQDLIRVHGQPGAGLESLQVEINRKLYLDEDTREPTHRFPRLRVDLGRVLRIVADFIHKELAA